MIDAGYFAKGINTNPDWLAEAAVREVCSVSLHVSTNPEGWIERWLHNGFGWFNRPADARAVVSPGQAPAFRLFGYRVYPYVFRAGVPHELVVPADVRPDPITDSFQSLGFDSVSKASESALGFDCSPLSCNSMAAEMAANERCLFDSLDDAIAGATRFSVEQPEPGDYYVVEVLEERRAGQHPLEADSGPVGS